MGSLLFFAFVIVSAALLVWTPGYVIAQRRGMSNPWVAFVPIVGIWIVWAGANANATMGRARVVIVAVVAALALTTLANAATPIEKYQYKRTAEDDAKAAAMVFQRSDLPPALVKTLKGGRVKPDETPGDACDGRVAKQSDLAVTGDAESRYSDSVGVLGIDTQVSLFKTAAMASLNWNRQKSTMTATCFRQILAKQRNPGESLVSLTTLPALRCGYHNASFVLELTYNYPGKPRIHYVFVITALQSGRTQAMVATSLREMDATAPTRALNLQGIVLKAVRSRLSST